MNDQEFINLMNNQSAANSAFNALEAQKNRDWQERLSNTAHVREVADLQNAGLNPILSANNGAVVPSGSTASADESSAQGYASLAKTAMDNVNQMAIASMQRDYQLEMARISADATIAAAGATASAMRYSADVAARNAVDVANINLKNSKYGSAWAVLNGFQDAIKDYELAYTGY